MDWTNKNVTVMGFGLNGGGLGVSQYLLDRGAIVTITDLKSAEDLLSSVQSLQTHPRGSSVRFVLGEHRKEDFTNADVVIKNPAIPSDSPYLQLAHKANVSIQTDLQIFLEYHRGIPTAPPIIGITGTRGKTTTSSLIAEILRMSGKRVALAGNVRKSVLDILPQFEELDYIVLELSSFQLADVTISPEYAVITNIYPDHLNRYDSMKAYVADKQHIYQFQTSNDTAFFWIDQPEYGAQFADEAPGNVVRVSVTNDNITTADITIRNRAIYGGTQGLATFDDIALRGEHNQLNASMAIAVAHSLGIQPIDIQKGLQNFQGVSGRQESLGEFEQVEYINDTTSTMPVALITALKTYQDKPLHLICGGENKRLTYENLAQAIHSKVQSIVLLPGEASQAIKESLAKAQLLEIVEEVETLADAIDFVAQQSQAGDRVLFSPGATSFGQFQNEFDRGDTFVELVKKYYQV